VLAGTPVLSYGNESASALDAVLSRERHSLEEVCSKCHNLQLVTDTPKSVEEWQDTLQMMVDRGARGTDQQFDDIMDYLHRTVTTINVNAADTLELEMVLHVGEPVARAIVDRRERMKFKDLDDLKTVSGIDVTLLDSRARLIFF
jgi:competence protein ComEA